MLKGFYNLTSGMLTQQRNLNVVANNLVNVSTAGFKEDRYTSSTFDDVMFSLIGNKNKREWTDIGRISYIRASDKMYTSYRQGVPEPTGIPLDFAIQGDGFFAIENNDGETVYTRTGTFSLDDEGYLYLNAQGWVLDPNGERIQLQTDKIRTDIQGRIFTEDGGYLGQVGVYEFEDVGALEHNRRGLFTGAEGTAMENPQVLNGYVERSNVDLVQQMTEMMTSQRAFQSAAQVAKMYDTIMSRAANDIAKV